MQDTLAWEARERRGRDRPRKSWVRTMRQKAGDECWRDFRELVQDRR